MARAKKSRSKVSELEGQADPQAALDAAGLLAACQGVLARLEADLLERARSSPAVTRALEARYQAEKAAERTAESFAGWSQLVATQVGAAWILSCVFVRTLEDRGLLQQARLAGPGAEDSQRQFFQLAPSLTERDYLLTVFRELAHHPATRDLFDERHSPVWKLSPSAAAAQELVALFRTPDATAPAFRFGQSSTRFLGDLYQDLSEDARKRYALLQTPDFIESFILDRTLEPAIQRFGLDDTTLIDPTCGSGHFLLGAFDRLFDHRLRAEPGVDPRVAAGKALDCVYGADINPYAVAIARFRLTLSFLDKAGYRTLAEAPALPLHLVVADSLRINPQHAQAELWQQEGASAQGWLGEAFTLGDEQAARDVLFRQYAAVVGNPPYITVKDAAMREVYRAMYVSASGKYALSAPFCERFFHLARPRGSVGQITSNSFMKREFGRRLVTEYLPSINLTSIINTAGAFIPGHGTPTLLLFGTHEAPQGDSVAVVLANHGEPATPAIPAQGEVWSSIAAHHSTIGFENEYITVVRLSRAVLAEHPWSLGGGQAAEVKEQLESRSDTTLGAYAEAIGPDVIIGEEDLFTGTSDWFARLRVAPQHVKELCEGECVRDWVLDIRELAIFPYTEQLTPDLPSESIRLKHHFWAYRNLMGLRRQFGKTMLESGLAWYEYRSLYKAKRSTPLSIVFAEVASHNHFVVDRGGKVFKQSAPVIKLPSHSTLDDHLALVAYLNSSTACFYMRQVAHQKQMMGGESIRHSDPTTVTFAFNGGSVSLLPLPRWTAESRAEFVGAARKMEDLAEQLMSCTSDLTRSERVEQAELDAARARHLELTREMVGLQEWLDWLTYHSFGLVEAGAAVGSARPTRPGLRAFEVLQGSAGRAETIDGHPIGSETEAAACDSAVIERLRCIRQSPDLAELEQSQFKRRWIGRQGKFNTKESSFDDGLRAILEHRVLSVVEDHLSRAASVVSRDALIQAVESTALASWLASPIAGDLAKDLGQLLYHHAVPFLGVLVFSEAGHGIFQQWGMVWQQQRRQDAGEELQIAVPRTYEPRDYARSHYQAHRGKRNVEKERFISYPGCESDSDGEPVYGWTGWDHLQRAQALATLYLNRRDQEGWTADRLTPMLAGLLELIPWVKQWHNEPSEEFGGLRMGDYYEQFLDGECRRHGKTHDDLHAWRPARKARGGKVAAKGKAARTESETAETGAEAGNGHASGEAAASKKRRTKQPSAPADASPAGEEAE